MNNNLTNQNVGAAAHLDVIAAQRGRGGRLTSSG